MALTDSLEAYWTLDEASGTRADSTANGLDLTDNNTVGSATGVLDDAASFVAANSESLSRASAAGLQLGGAFSVSFWVSPANTHNSMILKKYPGLAGGSEWAVYNNSNTLRFYDGGSFRDTGVALANNTWKHVVLTRSTSGGNITPYVNGVAGTPFAANAITTGTNTLYVGEEFGTFYFDGLLDEIGIWSRALTAGEVADLYNGGAGLAYPFAVASSPLLLRLQAEGLFVGANH